MNYYITTQHSTTLDKSCRVWNPASGQFLPIEMALNIQSLSAQQANDSAKGLHSMGLECYVTDTTSIRSALS